MCNYSIVTVIAWISSTDTVCVFYLSYKNIVKMPQVCLYKHFVEGLAQMLDFNELAFKDKR